MTPRPGPFTGYGRRSQHRGSVPGSTVELAPPEPPRKQDCPGHVKGRDDLGRYPVGDCGEGCVLRKYRRGLAKWNGQRWV